MPNKQFLILVPGLMCDEALWNHQVEHLSDIAEIVVTDKHAGYTTISEIAEAIMDDCPPTFALAGLSMGGYIALEMVRRWPDRVEKLALLDTSPHLDMEEQRNRRYDMIGLAEQEKFDEVISAFLKLAIHPDRLGDRLLTEQVTAMDNRAGAATFVRQQHAIMSRRDQVLALTQIDCPTCIVCGEQDALTPTHCSEAMLDAIPHAWLVRIDHCGHMTTMERPEEVTLAMREWLVKD